LKVFRSRNNDLMEGVLVDAQIELNKVNLASKKTMEFEFGCLPDGKWDFVIYNMGDPYLKNCAERMAALMPADLKETWKVTVLK